MATESKIHHLKCWPEYFAAILKGVKTFELRINDGRDYRVGDIICEHEYNPETDEFTGLTHARTITYQMNSEEARRFGAGLQQGWSVMALSTLEARVTHEEGDE